MKASIMGKIKGQNPQTAPPHQKKDSTWKQKISIIVSIYQKNKLCNSPQDKTVSNLFSGSRKTVTHSNVKGEINKVLRC